MKTALMILAMAMAPELTAASVTTIQKAADTANVNSYGISLDRDRVQVATRFNSYGLDAAFGVVDFEIGLTDLGLASIDGISSIELRFSPASGPITIGRFDTFWASNASVPLVGGSTLLQYDAVYGHGFSPGNPPSSLGSVEYLSTGDSYVSNGQTVISLDLSQVEAEFIQRITNQERVRLIFSEAVDTTVTSWGGIDAFEGLHSEMEITATGVIQKPAQSHSWPGCQHFYLRCFFGKKRLGGKRRGAGNSAPPGRSTRSVVQVSPPIPFKAKGL